MNPVIVLSQQPRQSRAAIRIAINNQNRCMGGSEIATPDIQSRKLRKHVLLIWGENHNNFHYGVASRSNRTSVAHGNTNVSSTEARSEFMHVGKQRDVFASEIRMRHCNIRARCNSASLSACRLFRKYRLQRSQQALLGSLRVDRLQPNLSLRNLKSDTLGS